MLARRPSPGDYEVAGRSSAVLPMAELQVPRSRQVWRPGPTGVTNSELSQSTIRALEPHGLLSVDGPQSVTRGHRPARIAPGGPLRPSRGHRLWTAAVRRIPVAFCLSSGFGRPYALARAVARTAPAMSASVGTEARRDAPRLAW